MKYLTIKDTRAILMRYTIVIFGAWMILVFVKDGEPLNIQLPLMDTDINLTVIRPHMVWMAVFFLASLIASHALAYTVSRWINGGKSRSAAAIRALLLSWSLIAFIVLYFVSKFEITNYVLIVSLLPLIVYPILAWELKRASLINH
ncbi:MAG: hypothetical protein AAFN93_16380 [Bacteroidota bacterium]